MSTQEELKTVKDGDMIKTEDGGEYHIVKGKEEKKEPVKSDEGKGTIEKEEKKQEEQKREGENKVEEKPVKVVKKKADMK